MQVLGFQHVGVLLGKYHEWGPNYGRGTYSKTGYTVLGPYHATSMTFDEDEVTGKTRAPIEHGCYGFFPGPTGLLSDEPAAERWALEVGIAMTFVELRFGFNPLAPIFNVDDAPLPAGPEPAPAPQPQQAPMATADRQPTPAAAAPATPATPVNTEVADDRPRTYGGETQEAPAAPAAPPPPPPPPPAAKQTPPGPSPAEEATGDVKLPSQPEDDGDDDGDDAGDDEERPAEEGQAPPPSDER